MSTPGIIISQFPFIHNISWKTLTECIEYFLEDGRIKASNTVR